MDKEDWKEYFKKSNCVICKGLLTDETVRDHDHLKGKFRVAAHSQCNLQYQLPKFVPVIFHNLSGYDSHLFIKQLGKSKGNINCIPNNEEKYISFSKTILPDDAEDNYKNRTEVTYIDSFKFMASSEVVLQNPLSDFSTKSSPKPFVSSIILTSPNRSNLFPSSFSWRSFHLLQIL